MPKVTKFLTFDKFCKLIDWLDEHNINIKSLHRDFSDGVKMAKLLKTFYPKLVDMHNYTRCHSLKQKLDNWDTLNRKVLARVGLTRKCSSLMNLANEVAGELECLLYDVSMLSATSSVNVGKEGDIIIEDYLWTQNQQVLTITMRKIIDNNGNEREEEKKWIHHDIYSNILHENQLKDDALNMVNQKILHIENLCHLLDEQIAELTVKVESQQRIFEMKQAEADRVKSENEESKISLTQTKGKTTIHASDKYRRLK